MSGLSPQHLQKVVQQRIDGRPSALLSSLTLTMTRGNPFYAGELINAMRRDAKVVRQADGTWQVSADLLVRMQAANLVQQIKGSWDLRPEADLTTVRLGIPDSVHGVILSQLDRLPEGHKLTLKVCSVIGHYFSLDLVSEACPQSKDQAQVQYELDLLEAERIVHQEDPVSRTYTFHHRTTQEVIYRTLLHSQRRQLHRVVAHTLAGKRPRVASQIAHHAYLGETWSLSMQYCLLAGEEAKQIYANQQSIAFFENALRSARELPETDTTVQRNTLHLALGELLVSIGQYEAAYEHLEESLLLAQALGDCMSQARACRWFGRAHELRGECEQALEMLDRGFDLIGSLDSAEEAELALIAGLINVRQGAYEQALELCERTLDVAERLDDASVRARTFNLMGIVDRRCGRSDFALGRFQQSLAQYERLGDVYGQATSHNLIANAYYARAQWTQAVDHYHLSLEMFTQIGDSYNQVLVNNNLAGIALKQGRLDTALDSYQRAIALLEQTGGSMWLIGALHMNLGNTYLQRQEPETAVRQLQLAHGHFKEATVRDLLPELCGLLAEAALLQGDMLEAEKMGQRSVELARELDMPCEEGHNLRILGEIAQANGHFDEAETHYEDSYAILKEVGDTYECAKTQLSLAELCLLQGSTENAEAALTTCERIFSFLDARLDLERVKEALRLIREAKG